MKQIRGEAVVKFAQILAQKGPMLIRGNTSDTVRVAIYNIYIYFILDTNRNTKNISNFVSKEIAVKVAFNTFKQSTIPGKLNPKQPVSFY